MEGLLLTTLTVTVMFCIVGFKYQFAGDKYNAFIIQNPKDGSIDTYTYDNRTEFC